MGGMWAGNVFRYNTAVLNVNTAVIHNTYVNRTVINNTTIVNNRASFNGPGGVMAQPTPQERSFEHEQHFQATQNQLMHQQNASQDRNQFASVNHGRPAYAAMDRVGGNHYGPNGRMANQQERIGQGIAHGQINPNQAQHLEHREQQIHQQVHNDREANGGRLNQQERQQVNREQNHESRKIQQDRREGEHKEGERR